MKLRSIAFTFAFATILALAAAWPCTAAVPDPTPNELGVLPGFTDSWARKINNDGLIAGASGLYEWIEEWESWEVTAYMACVWEPGDTAPTALPLLDGYTGSYSYLINDAGLIAGSCYYVITNEWDYTMTMHQACIWELNGGEWEVTGLGIASGYDDSDAEDMNASGQIVGECESITNEDFIGFIWDSVNGMQSFTNLPVNPDTSEPYHSISPRAINDSGIVIGRLTEPRGTMGPGVIWDTATDTALAILMWCEPGAINAAGQVAGAGHPDDGTGNPLNRQPYLFLWTPEGGGTFTNLDMPDVVAPDPVSPATNSVLMAWYVDAIDINDDGRILVYSEHLYDVNGDGYIEYEANITKTWVYADGAYTDMETVLPEGTTGFVWAECINALGQVAGEVLSFDYETCMAFFWDGVGQAHMLASLGDGDRASGIGINDVGDVVGLSNTGPDAPNDHAVLWNAVKTPGPLMVTTNADSGEGSLRNALAIADPGGTITFTNTLSGQTIALTNGQLLVDRNLTIDASALPGGIAIDGNGASRIFEFATGTTNVLTGLTLANGYSSGDGGAIYLNSGAVLTVNDSTLSGSSAYGWGGGIYNSGTLTLNNSTLNGNTADICGGIANVGTLALNNCTLSENTAEICGGIANLGTLSLNNSIVAGNTATSDENLFGTYSGAHNLVDVDPVLAPLGDYGGPTYTMPPLRGSPAIDAGGASALTTDQRGYPRLSGLAVDIGAVEFQMQIVLNTNDSGFGSLRQAIVDASSEDTVVFTNSLSGQTITLTSGQLVVNKHLVIDASALPGGIAIDGNAASRIFTFASGTTNVLAGLTLTNGYSDGDGGAIYLGSNADLTINNTTLSGNTALVDGGGIFNDSATLTLNSTIISGNAADIDGGGIYNSGGTVAIHGSTLSNNTSDNDGGGIHNNLGTLALNNSTLSGNIANYFGGGIHNNAGTLTLNNSTLNGNSADTGGGIYSGTANITAIPITSSTALNQCTLTDNTATSEGGAVDNYNGWTFLTNCTITGNTSPDGAGAYTYGDTRTETVVANTIIAGNSGGSDLGRYLASNPNAFLSMGYNLVGNGYTGYFTATGDVVNQTAESLQLAALGDNGGPTQTMLPLPGSPAIDAGGPTSLLADQRGLPRLSGFASDVGAVELQQLTTFVQNTNDSGFGSLRQAIADAGSGSTINFINSLSSQTIVLTSGQMQVNKDLAIDASALPGGIAIDGNGASRIFTFASGTTNVLTGLTLANGVVAGSGGAIYVGNSAVLTISNSTLGENSADYGGSVYNYYGTLSIHDSTLSGNSAANGGGIYNDRGTLTLNSCTLNDNSANLGGGIYSHTANIADTPVISSTVLNQCTLLDNNGTTQGGAVYNYNGWTFMTNCTVTGNAASDGAGAWTYGDGYTETVVANSIIAGNPEGSDLGLMTTSNPDAFLSMGHNLVGNGDIGYFTATGDSTNHTAAAIQLAPFGDYGGPTQTRPPVPGSPAIDMGGTTAFATDQRGFTRVVDSTADIGAVEFQGGSDIERFWLTDWDGDGNPFGVEFALGMDCFTPDANSNLPNLIIIQNSIYMGVASGFNPAAANYTAWVVLRSLDLADDPFVEIYRYDGPTGTTTTNVPVWADRTSTQFFMFDFSDPQPTNAFYRLEIDMCP